MSSEQHERGQRAMMECLYWWGVPTFFRCHHELDPARCDIALVGVPHSTGNGTTERDQHLGPRAVRNVSAVGRRAHMKFNLVPWESCRIHDLGDVPLPEANNNERCIEHITEFYRTIDAAGARAVSVGGDHSVTGGILQAIAGDGARTTQGKRAALVHFDAHTDAFEHLDHFLGAKKSAAHWASYLVRDGFVDATRSVQIGIRGNPRTLDWLEPSYELGYEVITKERYDELGQAATMDIVRRRIGDEPVYITFDLDCLDTTIAPGVANLEAGVEGLFMRDVIPMLQGLRGANVIGGDVVCLMPTKDAPNQQTSLVAMSVLFEIISLIADRLVAPGGSAEAPAR